MESGLGVRRRGTGSYLSTLEEAAQDKGPRPLRPVGRHGQIDMATLDLR